MKKFVGGSLATPYQNIDASDPLKQIALTEPA